VPISQSASKPNFYRVKTCSNCGLENGGDVLLCAGCGTELSGAGLSKGDAAPAAPCGQGLHFAGASPSLRQKSLCVRLLEWFLVLFALFESGTFYVGYRLYLTRGSLSMTYSSDISEWIYYFLRNVGALGILGYVLFRNSRWCQPQAVQPTGRESAMSKPEGWGTTRQDSGRVRLFELFLVLFVALAGGIFYSMEVLVGRATMSDEPIISSPTRDVYQMLSLAAGLGLLSYVLSRSKRGLQDLGLRWTSRDVAVALPLALASGLAYRLLLPLTSWGAEMVGGHPPQGPDISNYLFGTSISMATVLCEFLNGFFEELIVRGYLMTEVRRFTGSVPFAIFCSVAVQVSYHFYQGGPMALAHVGGFMVFAGYYAKTNRLLPPVLAHIAIDLYALVMYALRLS
jgi:membrane protease YdiL (CAAX protease family)